MRIANRLLLAICLVLSTTALLAEGGTISGTIHFKGAGGNPDPIDMEADPVCLGKHTEPTHYEKVDINENSTLKNVLISIESGLPEETFPVNEEPVVLDQIGCMYVPHVWGAMAGQPVEIRNSDGTLHNVHSLSKKNRQFNMAMPKIVRKKTKVFEKPEDVFAIKCDVHPWMRTWVGIFNHPFFTVSNDTGEFNITGLPAGTFIVRAWHEELPAQTQEVTIKEGEAITLDFTFAVPE